MSYRAFTLEEIESALPEVKASEGAVDGGRWRRINVLRAFEVVFESTPSEKWAIRCFTGVDKVKERSRDMGTDAIRLVLIDRESELVVANATRVHRSGSLESLKLRLADRLAALRQAAVNTPRCKCGAIMVRRQRKEDQIWFWGCALWNERHKRKGGR